MKLVSRFALINLLCLSALPAAAEPINPYDTVSGQQTSSHTSDIKDYLKNLGAYLGFNISQPPDKFPPPPFNPQLLDMASINLLENYVYNTFFGALPVNTLSKALSQFIPNTMPGADQINIFANATFVYQKYSDVSVEQQGKVKANSLIDQPTSQGPQTPGSQATYAQDPVSQAVFNILGTPDYSYCMGDNGVNTSCKIKDQSQVMYNVIGPIPGASEFFTYDYNKQLISQLNSNSLMGPLLYDDGTSSQGTGSPPPNVPKSGLMAVSQAQEAANFIRYASGAVAPIALPQQQIYSQLSYKARSENENMVEKMQAQATLSNYFTSLRIFAAQSSVGISNLYYILSKRLPQDLGAKNVTSEAASEFKMATRRLFDVNPDVKADDQWINKINGASSATVQKEIAILLAEMNYQMYLDRQLQERILLTNTILLFQSSKSTQPNASFATQKSGSSQ